MALRVIKQEDIVRMQATKPENTSLAAAYFKQRPMHNSTHIAANKIKKETGNIPVVGRGGPGVRPKHGAENILIEPMPIEIDDTLGAVEMDNYERATALGKNQIIDEITGQHYDMVRETMNALCCQAHHGKIDYMMKTESGLQRYVVEYGTAAEIQAMTIASGKKLSTLKYNEAVLFLSKLAQKIKSNGVGGPVEFIAAGDVFGAFVALANKNNANNAIDGDFVKIGKFKIFEDNDSYIDIDENGNKVAKSLCERGTICCRAVNAGQSMPFCRIDDTVQQNAVPFYTFSVERTDHRGTVSRQRHFERDAIHIVGRTAEGACRHLSQLATGSDGKTTGSERRRKQLLLLREKRRRDHTVVRPRGPYHLRRVCRRPLPTLSGHHRGGTHGGD